MGSRAAKARRREDSREGKKAENAASLENCHILYKQIFEFFASSRLRGSLILLLFAAGCQPPPPTTKPYFGPTLSMARVINAINANNQKLPSLFARHNYDATIIDDNGKSHFVNGNGVLLYRSPSDLRLEGEKDLVGTVFDLGTNDQNYWLKVVPELDTLWIGDYADLTADVMAERQIPIEPYAILQVLGITPLDTNLNDLPAPVMRFNNDTDSYMIVWSGHLPDRWVAQREVWYDRKSLLPRLIFLFDAKGRVILRARLSHPVQVNVPGLKPADWPSIATAYELFFPETGSKMDLTLSGLVLSKGEGPRAVPSDRSFAAPNPQRAGVKNIVEIR
jgi:hypothetical protein